MKKKAKKKKNGNVTVIVTAHDNWSGPEEYEIGFSKRSQANAYVKEVHAKNTSKHVPDYYETARIKE